MSKLKLEDYCTKKHKINISNVFKNYIKNLYITSYTQIIVYVKYYNN